MTTVPIISWVTASLALLAAALPVTQERLTRFVTFTRLSVTAAEAPYVIGHFTGLRRWRLAALAVTAPLTGLTGDPLYLVVGWCAAPVLRHARPRPVQPQDPGDDVTTYRRVWLLAMIAAVTVCGHPLLGQGATPQRLAHAAVVAVVAAAVPLAARRLRGAQPAAPPETAPVRAALRLWSARQLYLAATAIVVAAAFLGPAREPREPLDAASHGYTAPGDLAEERPAFTRVRGHDRPTCPWTDEFDAPCRHWLVNGEPFPQAAPYVVAEGEPPRTAPFQPSPDGRALVYLDRHDRRMVYENAKGVHHLTGALSDGEVPTPAFAGQNRYVALVGDGARITDTRTWSTVRVPGARHLHDVNPAGIVVATATRMLLVDHRGRTRMSLPHARKSGDDYRLRPDGGRLVAVRGGGERVETYDPRTGERLSRVVPALPAGELLAPLRWTRGGLFLVRLEPSDRVRALDLRTGELSRPPR
ncbi:hypothetical protein [Nonomuraea pusilla]|uniref:Uncharacterized protein n=1 Tax=Nonomuraea pusilla TaxID=46177 RepID=A0A1H7TG41_9ACTN|nr:hypothetical protein [Nonomuraea pusilla]SEL83683.1 hypothetical protein SAMN05660976_03485 [Nonomuraea pusilla]